MGCVGSSGSGERVRVGIVLLHTYELGSGHAGFTSIRSFGEKATRSKLEVPVTCTAVETQ